MNSSAYDTNVLHQEQTAVQHQTHPGHATIHTNMTPAGIGGYFHPHASSIPIPASTQTTQLQHPGISTAANNNSQVATNSGQVGATHPASLFEPRQVQLANPLEKSFFNTAAGIQTTGENFYNGVPPTTTTSVASNHHITPHQHHHHQQGNTILITNNFSAHQYGGTNQHLPETSAQLLPRASAGIVASLPSAVRTANDSYNNPNAGNIRIITTLPSTLHQPPQQQQQQQSVYNITKEVEATVRDDIIQLPQFYHTPHHQPPSAYTQHLSAMLPSHFTQQHFAATTTAPATLQVSQDDAQPQHQFFMSMPNDNDVGTAVATAATLTTVPKLMTSLTAEVTAVTDAITTSPAIITSPATTTNSNSTLVLDRINICINNHYSDSLAANNVLPTTTLDSNGTTTTAAITTASHTFSMAAHAPQQPSPIIPAIHHKVVLDTGGSGVSSGVSHTDAYSSNDSTLVIDEPDSTTTTPHTPPTTPENITPTTPTLNLTRTLMPLQSNAIQNVGDIFVDTKENYVAAQTVCLPSMKMLMNRAPDKTSTMTPGHNFTTITQSINLIDDDESDYANSEIGNDTDIGSNVQIIAEPIYESIMEIEDNADELTTTETTRMKGNTKTFDTIPPSKMTSQNNVNGGQIASGELVVLESNVDTPPSPAAPKATCTNANETASTVSLLTPPTPTTSSPNVQAQKKISNSPASLLDVSFSMGEDVFIRKNDGRQYLGTVIGSSVSDGMSKPTHVQYLVRFDDSSELWCGTEGMRRLGSSGGSSKTQMCVACKRTQIQDIVEICDDCRRGYHRSCTKETTPGSGVWWCIRCSKPMKVPPQSAEKTLCMPLPHHNRSYRSSSDAAKTSTALLQTLKATADIYEFHIEDNEIYTSDDEIPIKHIMDKARQSKDTSQISIVGSMKPKATKSHNTADVMLCEKIVVLDDDNANDANSISKLQQSAKEENKNDSIATPKSTNCVASLKPGKMNDNILATKTVEHNSFSTVYNKEPSSKVMERSSRKRKAFTLSNTYKEVAAEAASKRYDSSRICDSSSDENSSSSRGTSLDVIIPPPKNFLGLNNPFLMVTPKKNSSISQMGGTSAGCAQSLLNFNCGGTMIKSSIFNTTALDFSSKLAALKSAGIFPNLSTSNLAKAAGQPRTVRTIKRRLSAKDITIGPNQEVRRRRTRRLSSNIEIISTTTINPIPSNFFPIHAKDLFSTHTHHHTTANTTKNVSSNNKQQQQTCVSVPLISSSSSASASPPGSVTSSVESQVEVIPPTKPTHGRRLRQRPQKNSPANSRRSSISCASTVSSTNSSSNLTLATLQQQQHALHTNSKKSASNISSNGSSMQDLKQSVKEYFGGVINRIESGEQFCIRAKRQLANGQMQYLIEWGDVAAVPLLAQTTQTANTMPTSTTTTAPTADNNH